jgi:hypothetical protein
VAADASVDDVATVVMPTDDSGSVPVTACSSDKMCAAAGMLCDPNRHLCVECIDDTSCKNGTCTQGHCVTVQTCTNSLDCAMGHVCDKTQNRCVECVMDSDCPAMHTCAANSCRTQCTTDKDCRTENLLCDTTVGHCAECLHDADCKAGTCDNSVCTPYACTPSSIACVNGGMSTCSARGDAFGPITACPADGPCVNGAGCTGDAAVATTDGSTPPDMDTGVVGNDGGIDPTLVLYYKLDETSGTTVADSSGNGHTGTMVGTAAWSTGKIGGAANFDGATGYIETVGPVVDTSQPYTVSAWAMFASAPTTYKTVVSIAGLSASAFYLQYRQDVARFCFATQSTDGQTLGLFAAASAAPSALVWYHYAGVFDGANISLYVNGTFQSSTPRPGAWKAVGNTLVGRAQYAALPTDFWAGLIDDVRIYSRALSADEILKLANP